MPAVGDPGLGAVEHPLVLRLVVDGAGLRRETSEPASGSDTPNAASLRSPGVPKHCGIHSIACSGVRRSMMPATASVEPKIARQIPASPQYISSNVSAIEQPRRVGEALSR